MERSIPQSWGELSQLFDTTWDVGLSLQKDIQLHIYVFPEMSKSYGLCLIYNGQNIDLKKEGRGWCACVKILGRCTSSFTNIEVDNMLPWLKTSVANQTITRDPPAKTQHTMFPQNMKLEKYLHTLHAVYFYVHNLSWNLNFMFCYNISFVYFQSLDFVKFPLEGVEGPLNRCFNFDQVLSLQWTQMKSRSKSEEKYTRDSISNKKFWQVCLDNSSETAEIKCKTNI